MDRILIFDTTLRDGEQSPGATMHLEEKLEIARQLDRLGVDIIEAGFPISSPGDFEAVQRIAREVRQPVICALTHAQEESIDRAWEAVKDARHPRLHMFLSSSDIHLTYQLRKSREEVWEQARAMVARAKGYAEDIEFSPMDSTRTDPSFINQILEAVIDAGATTVNIPDTVGYSTPGEYGALIEGIFQNVSNIQKATVSVHCHNDLGLAVANSLAGVQKGARQVECTINGIGERAGNASMEEIVMALRTRKDFYDLTTAVDTTQIHKTSRLVSDLTGIMIQPNKAIVGANAFAHESGIHQDGVLKKPITYEIMDAASIGLVSSKLVMGKHSGRHAFRKHLEEMGYTLSGEDLNRIFHRFKELGDKKKEITDRDIEAIVGDELRTHAETYKLEHVQVSCGDHSIPTATVKVADPHGKIMAGATTGTGPVDAVYKAVDSVLKLPNRLIEFSVKSVTEGIDAIGEVTVRIESGGRFYTGRGASTDIIVASARAYLNALNKLVEVKGAARVQKI
ncbi:MAG: 2-isopropylmalate synthase [Chloroflexi bacterium]|nr:2-isopropylmalate synthase [Chloroflexota bacterium]